MRPFERLTQQGKARRLRRLAIAALDRYELNVANVRLIGIHTNTLFRVGAVGAESYVVRVCEPGWRTATDLRSEVMWLQDLSDNTNIGAPVPELTQNGEPFVQVSAEGVPEPRRCVVMSWIPGAPMGDQLTEENLYKMGALFARLHAHSGGFSPPPGFTQRKMDRVLARGEEDVLFGPEYSNAFTSHSRDILERTNERVARAFAKLYADPTEMRVIHNDLWHGNIKLNRGVLRPLDFEDTIWGYPVQDIAMALHDLMVDVAPESYEPLQRAFRQGYESLAPWPERCAGQIDTFRAGRMLWIANYVARFERQHLREHIDWLAGEFERFLDTGMIRKLDHSC